MDREIEDFLDPLQFARLEHNLRYSTSSRLTWNSSCSYIQNLLKTFDNVTKTGEIKSISIIPLAPQFDGLNLIVSDGVTGIMNGFLQLIPFVSPRDFQKIAVQCFNGTLTKSSPLGSLVIAAAAFANSGNPAFLPLFQHSKHSLEFGHREKGPEDTVIVFFVVRVSIICAHDA